MKHRIVTTLAALICIVVGYAGNISVENVSLKPGETIDLKISLSSAVKELCGVQFDVTLPEGFSLVKDNGNKEYKLSSNQTSDMTCEVKDLGSGSFRFILYSGSLQKLKEGELMSLNLMADGNKELGSYSVSLSNVAFSDGDGVVTKESGTSATVKVTNYFNLVYMVDGSEYKSYQIEYGVTITSEAAPTKEGYTFSGWSNIPATMPANDVTVTGTFTINRYKLVYKVDGEVYKTYEIEYGKAITPEAAPMKEGYTFSGWSTIPATMPAKDVTVTGSFTINKYKLIYKVDGEVYKTYEIEYGKAITPEAAPTKEGYTFSGWSSIPETMPAHDVEVMGTFTQVEFVIDDVTYEISGEGTVTIMGGNQKGEVTIDATVVINGQTYRVTAIADNAFKENQSITSVTIPDGINTIGDNAFNGCLGLIVINIGKDVQTIGNKAFANVGTASAARTRSEEGMLIVNCYAESVPQTATDAFENTPIENGTLMVEDNSVNAYKATSPWSRFGRILGFDEAAGINTISVDSANARIYDMQGNRLDNPQKGVNIIRYKDGKVKKVMVK